MRSAAVFAVIALLSACGKPDAPKNATNAVSSTPAAPPTKADCPADGMWAECSVVYRLERSGVAPKIDSTAKPSEAALGGRTLMLKVGLSAELEVHLYPDSTARAAAGARLDRLAFVNGVANQSIKRERTLVESANLIAMLTSINPRQRERVYNALAAGPPQPEQAQTMKPVKSKP